MKNILLIIVLLLAFSCAISKKDRFNIDFEKFEYFFIQNGRNINFYFIFNPILNKLDDTLSFKDIKLRISSQNNKEYHELKLENVFSGVYQNSAATFQQIKIFFGQLDEMELNGVNFDAITIETTASYKKNKYIRKDQLNKLQLQPNYSKLEFLKLYPKILFLRKVYCSLNYLQ